LVSEGDTPVEILAAITFASVLATTLTILKVAIGLGLVIFFHEMGHFLAAKWCDVNVERFSIGFGPILWSRKWGETEYAFSLIPFGGYVKMLGQDDMDPSQLSSEEIAEDPRSYSSKPVLQRMFIISAGVSVNVVTAIFFFALAFGMGVEAIPSIVGSVQPGMPAWEAGMKRGDQITRIDGRNVETFKDIMLGVALSSDDIVVQGIHRDGKTFKYKLTPNGQGTLRRIGVSPTHSMKMFKSEENPDLITAPGTPAALADPPFQGGDIIRKLGEIEIKNFAHLQDVISQNRKEPLDFWVQREKKPEGELEKISVEPNTARWLGLSMDIGPIVAIQDGSPAERAGLQVGDQIVSVENQVIGTALNPLKLNDFALQKLHEDEESEFSLTFSRPVEGAESKNVTVAIHVDDVPAWLEPPRSPDTPLLIPSLGLAFYLKPIIMNVEDGMPAEKNGVVANERILKIVLRLPKDVKSGGDENEIEIDFSEKGNEGDVTANWAYAFWLMQVYPTWDVILTVSNKKGKVRQVPITPERDPQWFLPIRGIRLTVLTQSMQADGVGQSLSMGLTHTKNNLGDLYLTLRNLFGGQISVKELHGPIGIAKVAYHQADSGLPQLLLFLGFLSVNLAVLNFLPIPVLDGGHMVFLCWEAVTRKRPSERVLIAATYCGMAFVLGLMVFVLYLDIFIHGGGGN
jgi:regulator of sigma E protease